MGVDGRDVREAAIGPAPWVRRGVEASFPFDWGWDTAVRPCVMPEIQTLRELEWVIPALVDLDADRTLDLHGGDGEGALQVWRGARSGGLRAVFDVRRKRWIHADAAPPDEVAAQVARCPSGALQYRRTGAEPESDAPSGQVTRNNAAEGA